MPNWTTQREAVLIEAADLINGDREREYGHPSVNFARIAALWSVYLGRKIVPSDVAIMMSLLKTARLMQGGEQHDGFVDAAGYIGIGAELRTMEALADAAERTPVPEREGPGAVGQADGGES